MCIFFKKSTEFHILENSWLSEALILCKNKHTKKRLVTVERIWIFFFCSVSIQYTTSPNDALNVAAHSRYCTWSCCCLANSICCLCFSICEAASFFCSSWAARSCSLRLLNWPIMPISWRSLSARLSGVPGEGEGRRGSKVRCELLWRRRWDCKVEARGSHFSQI